MNERLHPLILSEILDRTAQLYRSRFLVFLGIGLIPAGTIFVFAAGGFALIAWIGANVRNGTGNADALIWIFLTLLLIVVVPAGLAASALGAAAMSDASARLFLGETITIRNAYKAAWKRGWRYIGLYFLQGLAVAGAPGVLLVLAVTGMTINRTISGAANEGSALLGGLTFLLVLVLGIFAVWMLLRLCLAFPACVVEQVGPWNALKRGVRLSDGTRLRILLLYVLGLVLNQVLAMGVTVPAAFVIALVPGLQGQAHAETAGTIVLFVIWGAFFVVKAVTKPIYGIALTLFYFDQRIRKEGFDIEWMMQQAGMVAVSAPQPESAPTAQIPDQNLQPARASAGPAMEVTPAAVVPLSTELQEVLSSIDDGDKK